MLQRNEYTASASLLFSNTQFDQELFGSNFTHECRRSHARGGHEHRPRLVADCRISNRRGPASARRAGRGRRISVSGSGQADVAQVSATDPNPVRAAEIANTYVEQFVLFRQQADRSKIAGAQDLVQKELAALPSAQRYGSVGAIATEPCGSAGGAGGATDRQRRGCTTGKRSDLAVFAENQAERYSRRLARAAARPRSLRSWPSVSTGGCVTSPSSRRRTACRCSEPCLKVRATRPRDAAASRRRGGGLRASSRPASLLQCRPRDAIAARHVGDSGRGQDDRRAQPGARGGGRGERERRPRRGGPATPGARGSVSRSSARPGLAEILSRNATLDEALASAQVPGRGNGNGPPSRLRQSSQRARHRRTRENLSRAAR